MALQRSPGQRRGKWSGWVVRKVRWAKLTIIKGRVMPNVCKEGSLKPSQKRNGARLSMMHQRNTGLNG